MADGAVPQAIEKRPPSVHALGTAGGIVPQTFEDTWRIAEVLAKAGLVRAELRGKPENVMLMLMQGLELGLKPIQALTQIYVVDGVPSLSSKLKIALVRQSSVCEYFTCTFSDDTKATFKTKRRDQPTPVELTFTYEQAVAYGLTSKDNWKKKAVMLRWRAAGQLCDLEYSDVVGGVQTYDEARDMRERIVSGSARVLSSVGPPVAAVPDLPPEIPDEEDDDPPEQLRAVPDAAPSAAAPAKPANSGELTEFEKLSIRLDEAQDGLQLNKLASEVTKWPNAEEQVKLRQHFGRRGNDLRKAGK